MREAPFRSYVKSLAILAGGGLLLICGFNALVNPLNLYDGLRIRGFNDYKYRLIKHQRLAKAAEVRRVRPDCLVLGTSRLQIAVDPAHPGWGRCRAYNLALNNAGIYESWRYFSHAAVLKKLRTAVLEVEQILGNETQGGFAEERLMVRADGSPNPWWWRVYASDLAGSLLSWEGLRASWSTVFPFYERRARGPEDGFWEYTPVDPKMLRRGQRALFRSLEQTAFAWRRAKQAVGPTSFRAAPPSASPTVAASHQGGYQHLRSILRLAHREGVELHLVIAPSHARLWNGILESGGWPEFEARKRMVVYINEDEARLAHREPFPLWDFSGFNAYTTEEVPSEGDRTARMRWYWEAQHFTKELGDLMLDRIFGYSASGRPSATDFGVRIDSRNLDAHLTAVRAAGDHWRQSHPEDVSETARAVAGDVAARGP